MEGHTVTAASRPRSVIDVLAAMSATELAELRHRVQVQIDAARVEVARLEHEAAQLLEASRAQWAERATAERGCRGAA